MKPASRCSAIQRLIARLLIDCRARERDLRVLSIDEGNEMRFTVFDLTIEGSDVEAPDFSNFAQAEGWRCAMIAWAMGRHGRKPESLGRVFQLE